MIEQQGTVIAIENNIAVIASQRETSCSGCSSNASCGTGALAKVFTNKTVALRVDNLLRVAVGEDVVIGISEDALVKGSLLAYIVPIVALLIGGALGEQLSQQLLIQNSELLTLVFAFAAFAASFVWLKQKWSKSSGMDQGSAFQPVMLRRS